MGGAVRILIISLLVAAGAWAQNYGPPVKLKVGDTVPDGNLDWTGSGFSSIAEVFTKTGADLVGLILVTRCQQEGEEVQGPRELTEAMQKQTIHFLISGGGNFKDAIFAHCREQNVKSTLVSNPVPWFRENNTLPFLILIDPSAKIIAMMDESDNLQGAIQWELLGDAARAAIPGSGASLDTVAGFLEEKKAAIRKLANNSEEAMLLLYRIGDVTAAFRSDPRIADLAGDIMCPLLSSRVPAVKDEALKMVPLFRMNKAIIKQLKLTIMTLSKPSRRGEDDEREDELCRTIMALADIARYDPAAVEPLAMLLGNGCKVSFSVKATAIAGLSRVRTIESVAALMTASSHLRGAELTVPDDIKDSKSKEEVERMGNKGRGFYNPYNYSIGDIRAAINILAHPVEKLTAGEHAKRQSVITRLNNPGGPLTSKDFYPQIRKWFETSRKALAEGFSKENEAGLAAYIAGE